MKRFLAVCLILSMAVPLPEALAADDTPPSSALDIVPADAAFFASWSRQGEQFEILRDSKAFGEFLEIPQVREALGPLLLGEFDLDNPDHVTLKQWLSQPFMQVGLDALSHEIFVYGDGSFTEAISQFQKAAAVGQRARLEAIASGKTAEQAEQAASRAAIRRLGKLRVPDMVFGFRVKDSQRARSQLMLLDGLIHLTLFGRDVPPLLREQYGREMIQGQQFLTFKLDGSMIPLSQFKFDEDAAPEVIAATKAAIRMLELAVAVGFIGDYAIVSLGDTTEHLQRIGQGNSLSAHPDLARLIEQGDRRFTSIQYVASDYRTAIAATPGQLAGLAELVKKSADEHDELSDETLAKVEAALEALEEETRQDREQRAATLAYTYLTDDGYEGYRFGDAVAGSQPEGPMSVLLHVGADPIGVSAGRNWIGSVDGYASFSDQLVAAVAQLEQSVNVGEANELRFLWYQFCDLARQFDTIMRQQVVPALAGGQAALVISASERSKQWHPEIPPADPPLPLPEIGLVVETNDPLALLEALDDAYQVIKAAVRLVSDSAEEIPPLEIKVEETGMGRLYSLPMWPELTRIDPVLLAPTAGLSDRWLVLTLRPGTATTLLRPTGWIPADISAEECKSLTSLSHLRPGAATQVVLDWLAYFEQTLTEAPTEEDAAVLAIYRSVLQLVGCLKSYTRTVRCEGETSVTHTVWRLEDRP